MKLDCHVIEDLLPLYHDGVCSEESKALVEAHLQDCQSCTRLLHAMEEPSEIPHTEIAEDKAMDAAVKGLKAAKQETLRFGFAFALLIALLLIPLLWIGLSNLNSYLYSSCEIPLNAEALTVLDSGIQEDGTIYYVVGADTDFRSFCTVTRYEEDSNTIYISFQHSRRLSKGEAAKERTSVVDYLYPIDAALLEDYDVIFANCLSDTDLWNISPGDVDRLVYRDGDGKELVIYDVNAK